MRGRHQHDRGRRPQQAVRGHAGSRQRRSAWHPARSPVSRPERRREDHDHAPSWAWTVRRLAGSPSTGSRSTTPTSLCGESARCWTRRLCTADGAPTTTCSAWPSPRTRPGDGSMRCSPWSGCPRWPASGPRVSRSAWDSAWGSLPALLGDPQILMFDEPVNGLDPEGILWIRNLDEGAGRRGPDDLRIQPPDVGDGEHRRSPAGDRPGEAHRGLHHRGVHRRQLPEDGPGPHAAAGSAGEAGHDGRSRGP